jgi:hypothetical protein
MVLATGWSSPDWSGRASPNHALALFFGALSRLEMRARGRESRVQDSGFRI